jgi:hypothetical protein
MRLFKRMPTLDTGNGSHRCFVFQQWRVRRQIGNRPAGKGGNASSDAASTIPESSFQIGESHCVFRENLADLIGSSDDRHGFVASYTQLKS